MAMTPLIEITRLGFANGNRVFAKCENHNALSHSHYDRVYRHLFDRCLASENISWAKNTHLFETSSGNAGTSFARFCDLYGFRGTVVFPKCVRKARLRTIERRNVNVILSQNDDYMDGARNTMVHCAKAAKLAGEHIHIMNHSQLWESVIAMESCGREIIEDLATLSVSPDLFVSALGNGTSTSGIGLPLKVANPEAQVVGFEPSSAPVYSVKFRRQKQAAPYQVSPLTGTGVWGISFPNFVENLLSDIVLVDDSDAGMECCLEIARRVEDEFGESIGNTSAAAILVAMELTKHIRGKNLVTVFYDVREYY